MEKIKTPLMARAKQINDRISAIDLEEESIVTITAKRILEIELKDTVDSLKDEREMIEKVHNDSVIEFIEALGMEAETDPQRAKDYFTQTFESYE